MTYYSYFGRDHRGRKKKGYINAESRQDAAKLLRTEGIAVVEMVEKKPSILTRDLSLNRGVKLENMVVFLRQFATLIKAGISIVDSVEVLSEQTEDKKLASTLKNIGLELKRGQSLSQACEAHKNVFTPLMINMIKAGETGGQLEETLERLAVFSEKQHELKSKITSALFYPVTVGVMALSTLVFIMVYVVPTFANMFASFNAKLPAMTLFVLNMSRFLTHYWWIIILAILLIIAIFYVLLQNNTSKFVMHYGILRLPVFGKLIQKSEIARIMRTLSSLFASSVPILQSLEAIERITKNEVIKEVLQKAKLSLESGQSMALPLKESWVFPPLVYHMIAVGERTGSLDFMLSKVADFYESEVDHTTERLKSLIEPVMIVILSTIVGFIVLSVVMPMFKLYNSIG